MAFLNKHTILFLLLATLPLCMAARQPGGITTGKTRVVPVVVEQRADSVYIVFRYDFSDLKVPSRLSIEVTPVLAGVNREEELPSLSVKGRNNYHISKRKTALMSRAERARYNSDPRYAILKGYGNRPEQPFEYKTVIPFREWMNNAHLTVREELAGCGRYARLLSVSHIADIAREQLPLPEVYRITPQVCYIRPQVEAEKRRQVTEEAFIDFAVGKTEIRPDYMNNGAELAKITEMLDKLSDTLITVRGITLTGYASPEGSLDLNRRLSEGRARALADFLLPRFPYPKSLYYVEFGGENWDGLREAVEGSDMPDKRELLYILDSIPAAINYTTNTSRKKSLMDYKMGDPYRYMLREFFPHLRKAVCRVDYRVPGFNLEQARTIFEKRPGDLSLEEMYRLAMTYEAGSAEFIRLFDTAVRLFPDDPTANLNAASAALSRGDTTIAEYYLRKARPDTPEYDNAMGVLLLLKEDYDGAETYLRRAARAGVEEAEQNLTELNNKRENLRARNISE